MTAPVTPESTFRQVLSRPRRGAGVRIIFTVLALALAAPSLSGCATNPATGEQMLSFMSPQEEKRVGAEEHPKLVEEYGGEITDKKITDYVTSVGNMLVKKSEMPNLHFTFTVLDTPIINAFALPGGYIHITRGLMALANSEAELAGVMAHEIGHVTARHAAQRYSRNVIAGGVATVLGVLTGSREVAQLAGQAGQLAVLSYSREQEFQADKLGLRYLRRAGFDTHAMADFLASLRAQSRLEAKIEGLPPDKADQGSMLATHPRTVERVERAAAEAGNGIPVAHPIDGRDVYLKKIDGIIFGDSPSQGFARGRDFLHPELRFKFRVPKGFELKNGVQHVVATGPDDAVIIFDGVKRPGNRTMMNYLVNVWARGVQVSNREEITVNGLPTATGDARVRTNAGIRNFRFVAIQDGTDQIWRMLFVTKTNDTQKMSRPFRETTYSFRKVSRAEAATWKPWRIHLHKVVAHDTVESLAKRMPFKKFKVDWFRVLNGLGPGEPLKLGQTVKLVLEG